MQTGYIRITHMIEQPIHHAHIQGNVNGGRAEEGGRVRLNTTANEPTATFSLLLLL